MQFFGDPWRYPQTPHHAQSMRVWDFFPNLTAVSSNDS